MNHVLNAYKLLFHSRKRHTFMRIVYSLSLKNQRPTRLNRISCYHNKIRDKAGATELYKRGPKLVEHDQLWWMTLKLIQPWQVTRLRMGKKVVKKGWRRYVIVVNYIQRPVHAGSQQPTQREACFRVTDSTGGKLWYSFWCVSATPPTAYNPTTMWLQLLIIFSLSYS